MRYGDVKWEVNTSQILLIFLTKYQSLVFHIVSSSMQQISNVYIYIYINILSAFRWYAFALVSMYHIDGLIQDSSNIIANALELQLSCARPPICNARNRSYSICSTSPCAGNVFIWDGFGIFCLDLCLLYKLWRRYFGDPGDVVLGHMLTDEACHLIQIGMICQKQLHINYAEIHMYEVNPIARRLPRYKD